MNHNHTRQQKRRNLVSNPLDSCLVIKKSRQYQWANQVTISQPGAFKQRPRRRNSTPNLTAFRRTLKEYRNEPNYEKETECKSTCIANKIRSNLWEDSRIPMIQEVKRAIFPKTEDNLLGIIKTFSSQYTRRTYQKKTSTQLPQETWYSWNVHTSNNSCQLQSERTHWSLRCEISVIHVRIWREQRKTNMWQSQDEILRRSNTNQN